MLVTIITVVYNCETTISRTIESVLAQTYRDIEYIIIDGVSSDNTVSIANSYSERFEEYGIKYIVLSEKDSGMYDALNKGAHMAHGEIIGQINADDWYEPNAVEKMVALYEREQYDFAWADLRIIRESGNIIKKAHIGKPWTTAGFCHPTMFSRKDALEEFPYACRCMDDDFDMITRAYSANKKIVVLNEVLANYSFGGMSTKKSIKDFYERIKMKYSTYRRNGFSRWYLMYCIVIELAKYVLG